jgi:putative membrane protein
MVSSALLSTLHLLALGVGLPSVFARGRALAALEQDGSKVDAVLRADNVWGLAAVLWLATGLARLLGPFEKGTGFYLNSGSFLVKMGLFVAILLLEVWPMVTFIRWRIRQVKRLPIDTQSAGRLRRVNQLELGLTLAMPFFASLMARGLGHDWFR